MTVLKKGCKVALSANMFSIGRQVEVQSSFFFLNKKEQILTKLLSLAYGTAGQGAEYSSTLRSELNSRLHGLGTCQLPKEANFY